MKLDYDSYKRGKSLLALLQALVVYIEMSWILSLLLGRGRLARPRSLMHVTNAE